MSTPSFLATFRRDLTLAFRAMRRSPTHTLSVLTMLALAIGAATAVFSVVHGVLVRPLPHIDTNRWADVFERPLNEGLDDNLSVSVPNYRDWKRDSRTFSEMVLWWPWNFNIAGSGETPERLQATVVTPNLFSALELQPAAGRLLQTTDDPINGRLVLISYSLWERRFARNPAIVGQNILLNHVPFQVVGVTPPDFSFPVNDRVDVYVPESATGIASNTARDARGMQVSAMLQPGATFAQAQAELDGIARRMAETYPEDKGFGVAVVPMREVLAGDLRQPLLTLFGALGLIVLLVSVNVANLQLVRLEGRRHEFAVRAALGASRGRLLRQAITESLVVSAIAGALGYLLAPVLVRNLLGLVPADRLPWLRVSTDTTMLAGAIVVGTIVTLLSGILPALLRVRHDAAPALARGGRGSTLPIGRRLRQTSVVVQLALSLVLVVGSALLIQTFQRLQQVDPGFNPASRMTLSYFAPRARYADRAAIVGLVDRVREELSHAPGVRAVGLSQALPFSPGPVWMQAFTLEDPRSITNLAELPHVHYNVVSAGYAEALGVPVLRGRAFDSTDTASSLPVVVINDALARRFFPNQDPIGQELSVGHAQALPSLPRRTVIGVVGDARWSSLDNPAGPEAWVPFSQQTGSDDILRAAYLVYHSDGDAPGLMPVIRERMKNVDADLPLTSVRTLESRLSESLWRQRLAAAALGVLGGAALAVALIGVFAVTKYLVDQRAHEMGVRLALGARPHAIVTLVLGESARLVLLGVACGAAGALGAVRLMASILYGVDAYDPATFLITTAGLASAALIACYVPARRASRVDPLVTLRAE